MPVARVPVFLACIPALSLCLSALLSPSLVAAATEETADPAAPAVAAPIAETITVTATRRPIELRTAGSSVTVLDREDLERRHATTVLELLRGVPGLEVVQGGGPGRLASVFLRGAGSAQTLVLVDGVRVASPASGAYDFADLTVDEIERIEVLRGPQSGLYGAEAMGGVVAIFTRSGEATDRVATTVELAGGNQGHALGRVSLAGGDAGFAWRLAVADQTTDGVSAASERAGNRERDGWDLASLAGSAGWSFGSGARLDATLRASRSRAELDGFGFDGVAFRPVDDPNYVQRRDAVTASLAYRAPFGSRWTQSVTVAVHDEDLDATDPDSPFNPFAFDTRSVELGTAAELELSGGHALVAGAAVEERSMLDVGFFDEDVRLGSLYLQDRWSSHDRVFVTVGLRHDDHSTFGGETTGRITLAVLASPSLRLHGSWGTGFRAPTFFDLFSPFGANPDLRPETSRGADLGVELAFGAADLDLTLFDNDFEDLIVLDSAFVPQNLAEARARGVEARLDVALTDSTSLAANWTYTDSEDRATGLPLPRRPRNRGVLELGFPLGGRLRGLLTLLRVADRVDTGGGPMEDYTRLDLALDARASARLRPFLRAENVLDEDYEEIPGFTSPGVTLRAGLRVELGG